MVRRIRGLGMKVRLPIPFAAVDFAVLCKLLAVMCHWERVLEMVRRIRGLGMEVRVHVLAVGSTCRCLCLPEHAVSVQHATSHAQHILQHARIG
jgi:hypothetical protein